MTDRHRWLEYLVLVKSTIEYGNIERMAWSSRNVEHGQLSDQ